MSFGRMISLVIAIAAIVAVFVEIPYVSDYVFWVLVGAFLVWQAVHKPNAKNWFRYWQMLSYVLLIAAIVAVFVYIPIVSDYAFWVLLVAYFIAVGDSRYS
jgi:uncharacterized membrane protein HdeD (DUF308 family)